MKAKTLVLISFLFVLSAIGLQAQNALPDAHNDACWQSLDSLRACQLQQEKIAADYAQRCTSYPEYQCAPPDQEHGAQQELAKASSKAKKAAVNANQKSSPVQSADTQSSALQVADTK